ncbi:MAG: hypothetical protein Q8O76_04730 [Chloroflexota bacterium]|nr:hypothetical protein [Chloroflexota bacterium]
MPLSRLDVDDFNEAAQAREALFKSVESKGFLEGAQGGQGHDQFLLELTAADTVRRINHGNLLTSDFTPWARD